MQQTKFILCLVLFLLIVLTCLDTATSTTSTCSHPSDTTLSTMKRSKNLKRKVKLIHKTTIKAHVKSLAYKSKVLSKNVIVNPSQVGSVADTLQVWFALPSTIKSNVNTNNPNKFTYPIGPTNQFLNNRTPYTTKSFKKCVACRFNCLSLQVFAHCKQKFHFYGCKYLNPCFNKSNATRKDIQKGIALCISKNGCALKKGFFPRVSKDHKKEIKYNPLDIIGKYIKEKAGKPEN